MSTEPPEIPAKPRRKKPDVAVHGGVEATRTYAANFAAARKARVKAINGADPQDQPPKISRKFLAKQNERLGNENVDLAEKLGAAEEAFAKRINRLKERLIGAEARNGDLSAENDALRAQNEQLMAICGELKGRYEAAKNCATCDELKRVIEKNNADYNLVRKTNKELLEDIGMLKNVVYRLNVHLERYQDKVRGRGVNPGRNQPIGGQIGDHVDAISTELLNRLPADSHSDHTHTPISWGKVNAHTLGPLLDAYQDTLEEKDEIIQSYEREMLIFTGQLKGVIAENESLHRRLTEDDACSGKLAVEIERLESELRSTRQQNDLLIKKCALKQDKLDEVLRCYERKVEQMKSDYAVLHEQFFKSRSEVAALAEKNKALADAQVDFRNERQNYIPVSVHAASVNECKKLYEELKSQYEAEKNKLRDDVTVRVGEIAALNAKISEIAAERDASENKIKSLERHIKKLEAKHLDSQHALNEINLSRSALRKQLHKSMTFARDLVSEQEALLKALNQRQQESKAARVFGTNMASRLDALRAQLKTVQKDAWQELSSVEERIKEQDSAIDAMKREHGEEVERLKRIIEEKEAAPRDVVATPLTPYLLFRDRNK